MAVPQRSNEITHSNNFDFIRIAAALAVLVSHQHALVGRFEPGVLGIHSLGGFAVLVFFAISGYLVTGSWISDPNLLRFTARRSLRVWPALTVVVVVSAYVLGPWVTELPIGEYLRNKATAKYLSNIWLDTNNALPGVFLNNPHPQTVNGSIWTIPFEVLCYAIVALVGLAGILKFRFISIALILIACIWYQLTLGPDLHSDWKVKQEMIAYFFIGALLFLLRPYWRKRTLIWLTAFVVTALIAWNSGFRYLGLMIGLPFVIIYFGTSSTPFIRSFGKLGDPSYGLYLFAFPIQQTIIYFFWPKFSFIEILTASIITTTVFAYTSWHCIEKTALKLKPHKPNV